MKVLTKSSLLALLLLNAVLHSLSAVLCQCNSQEYSAFKRRGVSMGLGDKSVSFLHWYYYYYFTKSILPSIKNYCTDNHDKKNLCGQIMPSLGFLYWFLDSDQSHIFKRNTLVNWTVSRPQHLPWGLALKVFGFCSLRSRPGCQQPRFVFPG